jgi:hypothetical protein
LCTEQNRKRSKKPAGPLIFHSPVAWVWHVFCILWLILIFRYWRDNSVPSIPC